jgi:hypothetical protein
MTVLYILNIIFYAICTNCFRIKFSAFTHSTEGFFHFTHVILMFF